MPTGWGCMSPPLQRQVKKSGEGPPPDKRANRTSQVLARKMSGNPTCRELACRCRGRLLVGRGFFNIYPDPKLRRK